MLIVKASDGLMEGKNSSCLYLVSIDNTEINLYDFKRTLDDFCNR